MYMEQFITANRINEEIEFINNQINCWRGASGHHRLPIDNIPPELFNSYKLKCLAALYSKVKSLEEEFSKI